VFDRLPVGEPAETVHGIYRDLVRASPGSVMVWPVDAPFLDVGTPADYIAAVLALAGKDVVIEGDAEVDPSATLRRCVVWAGATVGPDARLNDCVVLSGAVVPPHTEATGRVLGI
jgi:NDP-sugar pyrophosphorylase family protein